MLCERYNITEKEKQLYDGEAAQYSIVERDVPLPKYKRRFNRYGKEDIYGEYDINRVYRGFDFADTHIESEDEQVDTQPPPPSSRKILFTEIFSSEENSSKGVPVGGGNDTVKEENYELLKEEEAIMENDEESSGEYPAGYREMHTGSDFNFSRRCPLTMTQEYRALNSPAPFKPMELHFVKDALRMRESLKDIKKILLLPVVVIEDNAYYLAQIRRVIQNYEQPMPYDYFNPCREDLPSSSPPPHKKQYDEQMRQMREQKEQKQQERLQRQQEQEQHLTNQQQHERVYDERIDIEFKVRNACTDTFFCSLCDPEHIMVLTPRLWIDHCRLGSHINAVTQDRLSPRPKKKRKKIWSSSIDEDSK